MGKGVRVLAHLRPKLNIYLDHKAHPPEMRETLSAWSCHCTRFKHAAETGLPGSAASHALPDLVHIVGLWD